MERAQKQAILEDLQKKMVLLAGPRQSGKTTLAREIAKEFESSVYLNFDHLEDRQILLDEAWLPTTELLIFDEIHKMPRWKNYLKGIFDTKAPHQKILVTGSARLEIFNHVGDSLAGRYFLHRLLPLSPSECYQLGVPSSLEHFLDRGGFPEPFLAEKEVDARRWRQQYADSLLRTDVLDFEKIQNLNAIRLVFELLRKKVGSPISYSSIAGDVGISPNSVRKYIQIFEALYIVFRVTPYCRNIARSLLKEPKVYFFDTGLVLGGSGAKLENQVAVSLLKHTYGRIDYEAKECKLHYLRTKEQQEVDFALIQGDKVEEMIEVKVKNEAISKHLHYFQSKYGFPATQIVQHCKREHLQNEIRVVKASSFLESLFL